MNFFLVISFLLFPDSVFLSYLLREANFVYPAAAAKGMAK